ncbi:MAG: MarR family transcriptional regulator [Sedimenticola sp.]
MATLRILELLEASQSIEKKLNLALVYSRLRLPQFRTLLLLEKAGKMTVSDLSRCLNVTRATMSVLVNQLVENDLLEMVKHKRDKRSFFLQLSEKGRARLKLAQHELELVMDRLDLDLEDEKIEILNAFSREVLSKKS